MKGQYRIELEAMVISVAIELELLELESDCQLPPHPKLSELVRAVTHWKREVRKSSRDKVRLFCLVLLFRSAGP